MRVSETGSSDLITNFGAETDATELAWNGVRFDASVTLYQIGDCYAITTNGDSTMWASYADLVNDMEFWATTRYSEKGEKYTAVEDLGNEDDNATMIANFHAAFDER